MLGFCVLYYNESTVCCTSSWQHDRHQSLLPLSSSHEPVTIYIICFLFSALCSYNSLRVVLCSGGGGACCFKKYHCPNDLYLPSMKGTDLQSVPLEMRTKHDCNRSLPFSNIKQYYPYLRRREEVFLPHKHLVRRIHRGVVIMFRVIGRRR